MPVRNGMARAILSVAFVRQENLRKGTAMLPERLFAKEERDPDFPCDAFTIKVLPLGEQDDCDTDGHYRCMECKRRNPAGYWEPRYGWVTEDDLPRWSK